MTLIFSSLIFLALERAQARGHAHGRREPRRAGCASRHDPGVVKYEVLAIHAAGRSRDDRARTRDLDKAAHRRRRLASLTGVAGGKALPAEFVNAFDLLVIDLWCS